MRAADARIIVVTGKGGVGKTTVSAALALAAARKGRRVLVCETNGSTALSRIFGRPSRGYEQIEVANGLWTQSITSAAAIEDYVVQQIKFRKLYKMVFRNRVMGPFLDAVPGLHDLIQLGKVFDLEREQRDGRPAWDLVIMDAPATGHGLTMLASPRAMMELTVRGPFYENAKLVAGLYEDPARVSVLLVALPEELPVNETVELYDRLGPMRKQVVGIVLNEVYPTPLPAPAWYREHHASLAAAANPAGLEALKLADLALKRADLEERARQRLGALGPPIRELPFRYRRDLGIHDLDAMARLVGSL